MKNNREKLNHAFEGLRGDTIQGVVTAMETPAVRSTSRTRRFVMLTAACLAVVMMLGAVVAVPLLTADDPTSQPVTDTLTPENSLSYGNGPRVQMLSMNGTDSEGGDTSENVSIMTGDTGMAHECYLIFEGLEAGETVTLTSHHTLLALGEVRVIREESETQEMSSDGEDRINKRKEAAEAKKDGIELETETEAETNAPETVEYDWTYPVRKLSDYAATVTSEPSTSETGVVVFIWDYIRLSEEARTEGNIYEDYVDFVIRDPEGNITGAGSLYLADKKLLADQNKYHYSVLSVSRGVLLGSVRFDDPAAVTEDEVNVLISELRGKAEEKKASLFDESESTYSVEEMYCKNMATILTECYGSFGDLTFPDLVIRSGAFKNGWKHIVICPFNDPLSTRDFFFFEDGTYVEAEEIKCICDFCGEVEILDHAFNRCEHDLSIEKFEYLHTVNSVWLCYFTDGRIMKVDPHKDWETTFITEDIAEA